MTPDLRARHEPDHAVLGRTGANRSPGELVVAGIERRTTSMVGAVVDRLKNEILRGQFSAGSPLPAETELCAMLKVSRATLRESLQVLEQIGVVARDEGPRRRLVVPGEDVRLSRLALHDLLHYQRVTIEEVFDVLDVVGPQIIRLAAAEATAEDRAAIEATITAMAETSDAAEAERLHRLFHTQTAQASKNRFWLIVWSSIDAALISMNVHAVASPTTVPSLYQLHAPIARAVLSGEPEKAARSILKHDAVFKKAHSGPESSAGRRRAQRPTRPAVPRSRPSGAG